MHPREMRASTPSTRALLKAWAWKNVAIAAIYFALAEFPALLFPGASPFWPPAAVAALVALRWRWPAMPGVFAGSLLANLFASRLGTSGALIASAGNVLAPMVGAWLFARLKADADHWWDEPRQVLSYLFAMGMVQSALSAAVGIGGMLVGGSFPAGASVLGKWVGWSLGDASAVIMLAPLMQVLWHRRGHPRQRVSARGMVNVAVSLGAIVAVWAVAVFSAFFVPAERAAFLGLLLYPLIWSVFTLDLSVTLALLAFTFTLLTSSAALGAHVVGAASSYEAVVALEFFMLAAGGAVMFAASLQRSRHIAMRRLEEQAATLEELAMRRARSLVEQDARFRAQLLRLSDMNALLAAINQLMAQAHDDGGLLQRVCDRLAAPTGIVSARILRPGDTGAFAELAAAGSDASSTPGDEHARLAAAAWRRGQPVFEQVDVARDDAATARAALPLSRGGVPWAVLALDLRFADGFDLPLQAVAAQIAGDISIGLDRLDIARREREQSRINQALLSNMSVGICVTRAADSVFEHVNERLLRMLGAADRGALQARAPDELFETARDASRTARLVREVLRRGKAHREGIALRHPQGQRLLCDLAGTRLDLDDGVSRILWTAIDVSQRHSQAEQLRRVSAANAALLANTVVAIDMVRYPDRTVVEVNQGFVDMFGLGSRGELIGRSIEWIYPDDTQRQRMIDLSQRILRDGAGSLDELAVRRRDGATMYLDVHGRRLEGDSPQQPLIVWTSIDVSDRRALTAELNRLAMFDALTGLPNRRATEQHVQRAIERARRRDTAIAVGMIDLDDFKPINDRFGHEHGDRLLRELARRLRGAMRASDFVGRFGGDEFVIVLEDLPNGGEGPELEAILARVEDAVGAASAVVPGQQERVRMSLGLAFYPRHSGLPDELLRIADASMYRAKSDKHQRTSWWKTA